MSCDRHIWSLRASNSDSVCVSGNSWAVVKFLHCPLLRRGGGPDSCDLSPAPPRALDIPERQAPWTLAGLRLSRLTFRCQQSSDAFEGGLDPRWPPGSLPILRPLAALPLLRPPGVCRGPTSSWQSKLHTPSENRRIRGSFCILWLVR